MDNAASGTLSAVSSCEEAALWGTSSSTCPPAEVSRWFSSEQEMFHPSSHPSCCKDFWGSGILDSFSETPSSLLLLWAPVASAMLCCSRAGSCRSLSPLHEDIWCLLARTAAQRVLLWSRSSWDTSAVGATEGFPGTPGLPYPLWTCPQWSEGCTSTLLCRVPSREAQQAWEDLHQANSRQTCCSSLRHSPNLSCKLNCSLGSSPHAQPALQWEGLLSPVRDIVTPIRGLWSVPAAS